MRIHFWSADNEGSSLYRARLPAMGLGWLGHEVTVGHKLPADLERVQAVVGCRVATPGAVAGWREMKEHGVRLVLDLDDDYLSLDPTNPAYKVWADPLLRNGLLDAVGLADAVTVCSRRLVETFSQHHGDVRLVLNALPAQHLSAPREYRPAEVAVGWAGTASTVHELPLAARALSRVSDYRGGPVPAMTLLVGIGTDQARQAGVYGDRVGTLGFLPEFRDYLEAVSRFDVWVAPYRPTPFNEAKFATKALEAGFLGIPLVASAIEPYTEAVVHGETGFLVPPGAEHMFGKHIKQLVDDPDLRQRMGLAARAKASASILQARNQDWQKVVTK